MSDSSFDALMQELLQMFAVEAADHLQTLTQTLLKLERSPLWSLWLFQGR